MPKPSLWKDNRDTIKPKIGGGDKRIQTFPKSISLKGDIIARLVFELADFEAIVLHVNHYATVTPSISIGPLIYNV